MEANPESKTDQMDAGREKVQEWIAGCEAVREGLFNSYFIFGTGIEVTQENVDYEEAHIRNNFSELYPELIEA